MRKKASRAYQPSLLQTAPFILVTMLVSSNHPLLVLKRRLYWAAIREVLIKHLRTAGATERAMMQRRIGSLKSDKYKFNKPKARKVATERASGQRSVVSFNLNKLMRGLSSQEAQAAASQ